MKLFNAFSIQMINHLDAVNVSFESITLEQVKEIFGRCNYTRPESFIGHADFAHVLSNILGMEIPMNRAFAQLNINERAIVAQIVGGRLPEGSTTLPEGMQIKWYAVTPYILD